MKNTIVLYSTKNEKDALCIESMFRGYDMQEIYTLKPNITSEYMHGVLYTLEKNNERKYIVTEIERLKVEV